MLKYTVKRLAQSLVTILLIATIVFLLMRCLPTDYYFTEEQLMKFTEEQKYAALEAAGLTDPIGTQLLNFYNDLLHLDFGTSRRIQNGASVMKVIGKKFGVSMRLGLISAGISLLVGIMLGILQTAFKDKVFDWIGTAYTVFVNAVPSLVSYSLVLVFVTSSPEYVWDAFPVHPFDYLLKPYREEKLFQLADELRRVLFRAEPELEVRIARQQVHLPLRKIQYAMAQNHYVRIVSDDGECRAVSTFSQVEQLLRAQENFIVCNRGVILNMDKVLRLDSDCFEMLDGTRLPVRQKDKNTLFAQFTQYQFRHMRREL